MLPQKTLPYPATQLKLQYFTNQRMDTEKKDVVSLPCSLFLQNLHCRIYRFTTHPEEVQGKSNNESNSAHNTSPLHLHQRPATATGLSRSTGTGRKQGGASGASGKTGELQQARVEEGDATGRSDYPNNLQPWKPPLLFQFCRVSSASVDMLMGVYGYTQVVIYYSNVGHHVQGVYFEDVFERLHAFGAYFT